MRRDTDMTGSVFRRIINFHKYFWRKFDEEYFWEDLWLGWRGGGREEDLWARLFKEGDVDCWFDLNFSVSFVLTHLSLPPPPCWRGGAERSHFCPCTRDSSTILRHKTPTFMQIILEHSQVVYTIKLNIHSYSSLSLISSPKGYEKARSDWFPVNRLSTHILWIKTWREKNNQHSVSHNPRAACVITQLFPSILFHIIGYYVL